MSTRSMIAVQRYMNGAYELYYRHCDGYPSGLGVELIEAMHNLKTVDEVLAKVGAEDEKRTVEEPEQAFTEVQGDLEWIYAITGLETDGSITQTTGLRIYKTSCPAFWDLETNAKLRRTFVFRVWFSYVRFFPESYAKTLEQVDTMADIFLHGLEAYAKAPTLKAIPA